MRANLAFRNLTRAKMVKLATGQQMAAHLRSKGVPVTTLTKAQIRNGDDGAKLDALRPPSATGVARQHAAVVLHPARGRAQRRQAARRRRADRRRDVPPRDGGQRALDQLTPAQRDGLATNTPLWFYVLREAELNDGRMRGVGGRLVAETFHRAMEGSQHSIVRDPAFRPTFGPDANTFRMVDLLLFAFEGKKSLLAPLG